MFGESLPVYRGWTPNIYLKSTYRQAQDDRDGIAYRARERPVWSASTLAARASTTSCPASAQIPTSCSSSGPDCDEVVRNYTVRSVHGDEGIAGPWAAKVQPGETISFFGPAGAYSPRSDADWHLLARDGSAVSAISTALEALPAGVKAKVFINVDDATDEIDIRRLTSRCSGFTAAVTIRR